MELDRITVTDPEVERDRVWLSERMQERGLVAAPAYTIKHMTGRIHFPYCDGDFELCFAYEKDKMLDARLSQGQNSFWVSSYRAFCFDVLDELRASTWKDGVQQILGTFDESLEQAIKSRQLPVIPARYDLKGIAESKLKLFMETLGFVGEERPRADLDNKYAFKKGDIQLVMATAGRLDDGYVGVKTPKGYFDYEVLLKKLAKDSESMEKYVSRWEGGGYSIGDYYKVAALIRSTFAEVLDKVLPNL